MTTPPKLNYSQPADLLQFERRTAAQLLPSALAVSIAVRLSSLLMASNSTLTIRTATPDANQLRNQKRKMLGSAGRHPKVLPCPASDGAM